MKKTNKHYSKIVISIVVVCFILASGLFALNKNGKLSVSSITQLANFQTIINQIKIVIGQARTIWAKTVPTGFKATPDLSQKTLILSWDEISGADQYLLEKKINNKSWTKLATIQNSTSYNDSSLTYSTSYTYRMQASNDYGKTAYSPEVTVTTPSSYSTNTNVINGVCGLAKDISSVTAPTANLCTTGSATTITLSGTNWTWGCTGSNGGTSVVCTAPKSASPTPINGSCGTAEGTIVSSAPTSNLCSSGIASSVTLSSNIFSWTCSGTNGGQNSTCTAQKETVTTPTVGGKPGVDNTGPNNPSLLQNSSITKITTSGTVIQNANMGCIVIDANNVTIKNFRINGNRCLYGIKIVAGRTGTILEDGEISNVNGTGIYGSDFVARRLNIHDIGQDGIKSSGNMVIEYSWLHKLGDMGTHADGIQTRKGYNYAYRYNNFDMPIGESGYSPNANFMLETADGASGDITIDGNWLNGGNYTIFLSTDGTSDHSNVKIINNIFGKDFRYGTHNLDSTVTWSNNKWVDTGNLISL